LTAGVCIIHLIRGSFRYASRRYWEELAKDLKPVYQAVNADAAARALTSSMTSGRPIPGR
jgi:transposase-like protein